jgi:hypothetical protein
MTGKSSHCFVAERVSRWGWFSRESEELLQTCLLRETRNLRGFKRGKGDEGAKAG